ncbi:MAG: hypothetical protein ACOCWB_03270 [Bacteroidota bacterium]
METTYSFENQKAFNKKYEEFFYENTEVELSVLLTKAQEALVHFIQIIQKNVLCALPLGQ